MIKCKLCNSNTVLFHKGCRDNKDIDVFQCPSCGLLQLSKVQITNKDYEEGAMRLGRYNLDVDDDIDGTVEQWRSETDEFDGRRFNDLKDFCANKTLIDFGCGNGGFIKKIKTVTSDIAGVELDRKGCDTLNSEGIKAVCDIDELDGKYDIVTMFHVIEHLWEPETYLKKIRNRLSDMGHLIVEVPSAEDALISLYNNKSFLDFTFWSKHVFTYTHKSLDLLMEKNGFEKDTSFFNKSGVQRYSLSNHLYWLYKGEPGGHKKLAAFNDESLEKAYNDVLEKNGISDTLFGIYVKR